MSTDKTITQADVKDFEAKLKEVDRTRTVENSRERLIASGLLDETGKPRWPVADTKQSGTKYK